MAWGASRGQVTARAGAWKALFALSLLLASLTGSQAQDNPALPYPEPVGTFDRDTALLASPIKYTLRVQRPYNTQVLFPDTTYDYAPFELRNRTWFATRRAADSSLIDSAVYEFLCFSSEAELSLSLPVYYLNPGGDSLPVYAAESRLYQRLLPTQTASSDSLQAAIQTLQVPERFNYPYWVLGITLTVGLLALANVFLGRPIQRYFRLWLESRRHRAFVRSYDRLVEQVRTKGAKGPLERALNLWKAYMERVGDAPFTTYTTKDFAEHLPDPALTKSLQQLDRYIYGGFPPDEATGSYAVLRRMAIRTYAQKSQKLRNG